MPTTHPWRELRECGRRFCERCGDCESCYGNDDCWDGTAHVFEYTDADRGYLVTTRYAHVWYADSWPMGAVLAFELGGRVVMEIDWVQAP